MSSLLLIHQGGCSVTDYTIKFQTLMATSGWNAPALQAAYVQGLAEELKDELTVCDLLKHLKVLYDLSIRLDNHLPE